MHEDKYETSSLDGSSSKRDRNDSDSLDDLRPYSVSDKTSSKGDKVLIDQVMRQQLKDSIVMVDPVTRLFVKNALYLLLGTMAFVISTLPVSLTNIILLFFMTAIVIKALLFKS